MICDHKYLQLQNTESPDIILAAGIPWTALGSGKEHYLCLQEIRYPLQEKKTWTPGGVGVGASLYTWWESRDRN